MNINLSGVESGISTLGPSPAAVIWVQGCNLACRGCMSRDTWASGRGTSAAVADVADWLDATELEYLTISGGEPMDQAPAVAALVDRLDSDRWKVTCYSGYLIEDLAVDRPSGSAEVLARLDLLIDGPYQQHLHQPLRWRGSANQRLHRLSDRISVSDDRPAGLSIAVEPDNSFRFVGVPPEPHFIDHFEAQAPDQVSSAEPTSTHFPFPTSEVN